MTFTLSRIQHDSLHGTGTLLLDAHEPAKNAPEPFDQLDHDFVQCPKTCAYMPRISAQQ